MTVMKWTVRVKGAEIAVFEYGRPDAETTVLLVHGYPDDHHVFDPLIEVLGDDVRIIAYDTRGGGETTVDDGLGNYSIERLAADGTDRDRRGRRQDNTNDKRTGQ